MANNLAIIFFIDPETHLVRFKRILGTARVDWRFYSVVCSQELKVVKC